MEYRFLPGPITIANNGPTPINGWALTWTFTAGQQITQSWDAYYTQSGALVAFTNESYNAMIPAGGSVSGIGFNASWSDSNPNPTSFQLNGATCQ